MKHKAAAMTDTSESRKEASNVRTSLLDAKTKLQIGAWNVRTMFDTAKTAQVVYEMRQYKIHILGISESRWTHFGRQVTSTGETILYSGRDDNRHIAGVALILKKGIEKTLIDWKPISARMLRARFFGKHNKLTIIQCYSPTNDAEPEEKEAFYSMLQAEKEKTPTHDVLIIMGDLNAKVGSDNVGRERIMGSQGCGTMNENGEMLSDFCGLNNMVIGGTLFAHKDIHKLTWISPNARDQNQIDHIMINNKWRRSLLNVRVRRGADVGSDHHLLQATVKLKLRRTGFCKQTVQERFNVHLLKDTSKARAFTLKLQNRYKVLKEETSTSDQVQEKWDIIKKAYYQSSKEILGTKTRQHKEWISTVTWERIQERKQLKIIIGQTKSERLKKRLHIQYSELNKLVKKSARNDKRKYIDELASKAETAASRQEMSVVYKITKQICGNNNYKGNSPVMDKNGRLLTNEQEQETRWTEHFNEVLNRPDPQRTADIQPAERDLEIETSPPTKAEIKATIATLGNNKAPGPDSLCAEVFKTDPETAAGILHPLFVDIWEKEELPDDWTHGRIIKLPKKGKLADCNNWRGITLLSIPSKIFTKIIMMRMKAAVDKLLRPEQAGFRKGRGTTEHIFTLRNILEQCNEWQRKIYINFVDFEKAFDSVHRESLWKILRNYGIPEKLVTLIQIFYRNFSCSVGNSTTNFTVKSGVRQGCVMSSFLFTLAIDWITKTTINQQQNGIRWTLCSSLEDLIYADDLALPSHTREQVQKKTNNLEQQARSIGLSINAKKTKVLTNSDLTQQPIEINNNRLEYVDKFIYLGSIMNLEGGTEQDIKTRLGKARSAFAKLQQLWRSSVYSRRTKLRIYQSNVLSVLLYGSECWRMTQQDTNRLSSFHNTCLRKILKVYWPDTISNNRLQQTTKQENICITLKKRRWKWFGHVCRMNNSLPAKTALTWTPEGKRKRGRPKTTWRRTMEEELKNSGLTWGTGAKKAQDRVVWKDLVRALCATRH